MSRRTLLTFAIVAVLMFYYGASNTIGVRSAPELDQYTVMMAIGGLIALPFWIRCVIETLRAQAWGWFAVLIGFLWLMPVVTLLYGIAGPLGVPRNQTAASQVVH